MNRRHMGCSMLFLFGDARGVFQLVPRKFGVLPSVMRELAILLRLIR